MTPDELNRLRELHEQATPGPWYLNTFGPCTEIVDSEDDLVLELGRTSLMTNQEREDTTFAVETCNALPHLLDHIEKVTQRAERAEELLARINRAHPEAYAQALAGGDQ